MHKGLYWVQLIMGIGIGLIVAALVWMFTLKEVDVVPADSDHQIVYYNRNDFSLTTPESAASREAERFSYLFSTSAADETGNPPDTPEGTSVATGVTGAEPNVNVQQTPTNASAPAYPDTATGAAPAASTTAARAQAGPAASTTAAPTQSAPVASTSAPVQQAASVARPTSNGIEFVINKGDSTEAIAAKLELLGVCKAQEFLEKIYRLNLDRYIKAGSHQITKGLSIDEIIRRIIN